MPPRVANGLLFALLTLAAALRLWGIAWGLPSATHYFSYHPDESIVLEHAALGMNLFQGQLLPHFYNYGSLQLYLVNFAVSFSFLFGFVDIVPKDFSIWHGEWAKMYLIGRLLTVTMGVGTVWATYALGARLWGIRAGLCSALLLAVMPLHVQHSHFVTVDVPATFWVMLSLLWTVKLRDVPAGTPSQPPPPSKGRSQSRNDSESGRSPFRRGRLGGGSVFWDANRAVILAAVFSGFAAATKYNMALALIPVLVSCLTPPLLGAGGLKRAGLGLLTFILAFLVACPGIVLESGQFFRDLAFEAAHVQNGNDSTFKNTGLGFVYHLTRNMSAGLGWALLVLALAGIAYGLYHRERGDGLLAAFALPYYVLISLASVRYARYVIPLLPLLALWAGRLCAVASRRTEAWTLTVAPAYCLFALFSALVLSVRFIAPMAQDDPRDRAVAWLNAQNPSSTIGFPAMPWFQTAPVSPYFSDPQRGAWKSRTDTGTAGRIVYQNQDFDVGLLQSAKPEYVVLSEYDYDDPLRLHDPAALAYLEALNQSYTLARQTGVGKTINGTPSRDLPHDMLYTNPILLIYRRKQEP